MAAAETTREHFELRRVVQLYLAFCRCPGQEWQPRLNNYKLRKHSPGCEFRKEVESEFRAEKEVNQCRLNH